MQLHAHVPPSGTQLQQGRGQDVPSSAAMTSPTDMALQLDGCKGSTHPPRRHDAPIGMSSSAGRDATARRRAHRRSGGARGGAAKRNGICGRHGVCSAGDRCADGGLVYVSASEWRDTSG
eukprot:365978-Chlamydomonas_euryale.AAC.15